jgi:hypothetical protein
MKSINETNDANWYLTSSKSYHVYSDNLRIKRLSRYINKYSHQVDLYEQLIYKDEDIDGDGWDEEC